MDWALRYCSWHGHATYAPDETGLRERLVTATAVGEAWRCLRCGDFVPGEPRRSGPADHAPEIPHGRLLRDRWIMRALAVERALRALVLLGVAYAVFRLSFARERAQHEFESDLPLLRPLADQLGWNMDKSKILHGIGTVLGLSSATMRWIGLAVVVYATLQIIEAVGLWLVKRWGEYFAVVATSMFLPLEIYELTEHVTPLKITALLVNVVAVVWLIWSKRLFGVRGGGAAYHAEHSAESLLTVERAAVGAEVS
ncbi:DUF2127 domain-containing protein [Segniliparus rugosus]|uniref:DUF2127 domain-containing protein n=1 Tax=Segniliparus rugosus (strain ATCC BAA-974 / DSM 45345 / CCUG 50838 / CIP 108380 / JCM 13579 / CDC 945) TaxID=679197 RepID=E5XTU6_SEGRC|nr:DUF2127 domain-containing protein [Segniliparus rugosus]EFV12226.1 hypothetical protein HMPREF9336_02918 [Segniliparus rugosus ATCC BAA-974]